jgi:hypothetical protein
MHCITTTVSFCSKNPETLDVNATDEHRWTLRADSVYLWRVICLFCGLIAYISDVSLFRPVTTLTVTKVVPSSIFPVACELEFSIEARKSTPLLQKRPRFQQSNEPLQVSPSVNRAGRKTQGTWQFLRRLSPKFETSSNKVVCLLVVDSGVSRYV